MEHGPINKQRTPSRCREWERQRRIKFNDAISKLGVIVKSINKANNDEDADNVQYPKIEIVQKAIICLTNCVKEKTQLKADILALEVKLEAIEKQKNNKRDVSIQVTLGINKKCQNGKSVKFTIQQNPKTNNLKEKTDSTKCNTEKKIKLINKCPPKLPKLLPITNMKKENTIVMLPATPYIFPQRPVLFPQGPTIVLVDTNLQQLNKPTAIPIINRNTNDITKTTMVNVLPISAYSHPLSAKIKKSITKSRNNTSRKSVKKAKLSGPIDKKEKKMDIEEKLSDELTKKDDNSSNDNTLATTETVIETSKDTVINDKLKLPELEQLNIDVTATKDINTKTDAHASSNENLASLPKCSESPVSKADKDPIVTLPNFTTSTDKLTDTVTIQDANTQNTKIPPDKEVIPNEYKNKENKMQNIIDTTICENVVDGGNARLELAEELLAASPTAAFLMSFPLVSGNRADSPAEETSATNIKETSRRNETQPTSQQISYFDKTNTEIKNKTSSKSQNTTTTAANTVAPKTTEQQKFENTKTTNVKTTSVSSAIANENPFLNLPLPSIIPSSCTLTDSTFGLDFDCNGTKTSQATTYTTANNIFYKSDPFNTVKSTIYSTSSISSGHEFNSLGLYPCAMENYSGKNKSDYSNVEDNLMKINSSRLTYDIDLGWSHKGLDFVNCTTGANTFHKDTILTTAATPYSTAYNPFNPEFHVPLVSNPNKKNSVTKASAFPEPISSFYSQSTNLWPEDVSAIYTNSNVSRNFIQKQQNYLAPENLHPNMNAKASLSKFDSKNMAESTPIISNNNIVKSLPVMDPHIVEKYTKKSPNKMHINWMTSEIRPLQNNCTQNQTKESVKIPYPQLDQVSKKTSQNDSYFPINMHNFPSQSIHDELQVWPTARPAGTTEISIEPPPINLPTLVGDLALGPHDKKKAEIGNRNLPHSDLQSCGNFLSVTQLMNRSSDNMASRSNGAINESQKSISSKQNVSHGVNESNRKPMLTAHPQICYGFNDSKVTNPYENIAQFSQSKCKSNNKPEKISKAQKNNYSAEALIRGGTTCSQKLQDTSNTKFMGTPQKYNDFNVAHDSGVAQVSHFPPILDYSDNNYTGQQFSGTTLYNSTTNTISNTFYSNFMPGSSNLMTGNYASGSFSSDFVDYNQVAECNYTNQKYNEIKMKNNASTFQHDKEPSNYKSSRRESAPKHKLECSKKESSKKYQSKRSKQANEIEEWNDNHLLWQNKMPAKRHQNLMSDELTFSNYVGNQMPTQYQPDFFNSHIMQPNIQNVGPSADRSLSSLPVASRANFNLSALFPEITMKVQ